MSDYLAKMLKGGSTADHDGQTQTQKKLQKQLKKQAKKMKKMKKQRKHKKSKREKHKIAPPKEGSIMGSESNQSEAEGSQALNRIDSDSDDEDRHGAIATEESGANDVPVSNYNTNRIDSDSDSDDAAPPRRKVAEDNMVSSKQKISTINGVWTRTQSDSDDASPPRRQPSMKDGSKAGLVQLDEYQENQNKRKRELEESDRKAFPEDGQAETIYRDKFGNQFSATEAFEEEEEVGGATTSTGKKQKMLDNMGTVQIEEKLKRQKELEDVKKSGFARSKDDKNLQRELQLRARADDPLRRMAHNAAATGKGGRSGGSGVPLKQGLPNRFMIKPGYRWDGVDRVMV